jgi:hypothetical protein
VPGLTPAETSRVEFTPVPITSPVRPAAPVTAQVGPPAVPAVADLPVPPPVADLPVATPVAGRPDAGPDVPPDAPPVQAALPPRRSAAPVPVAAGALPSRAPVDSPVPAPPAPSQDLDRMAARSDLASSALSELRGLYEPSFAPAVQRPAAPDDSGLARRTPKAAAPAPAPAQAAAPAGPRPARQRSATEVRGMLSGFRAGVERGRAPQDDQTGPTDQTS